MSLIVVLPPNVMPKPKPNPTQHKDESGAPTAVWKRAVRQKMARSLVVASVDK